MCGGQKEILCAVHMCTPEFDIGVRTCVSQSVVCVCVCIHPTTSAVSS